MKNAIKYYYNLIPKSIHQANKQYKFSIEKDNYILYLCEKTEEEINKIYKLHKDLIKTGIYCHKIILNNNNEPITIINNEPYILLKIDIENYTVDINEIINFSNYYVVVEENNILKKDDWYNLWIQKIDYIEYQLTQIGKKYPIIMESINYYIGMTENSISLLNNIKKENPNLSIVHKRIKKNISSYELYNPLNFIIDLRVRDIAEYCKQQFFSNVDVLELIKTYIKNNYLTKYELYMFYIRMLFPSYYFDLYEQIISDKKKEQELIKIISEVDNYQKFLKELYLYIRQFINIEEIEWIIKT